MLVGADCKIERDCRNAGGGKRGEEWLHLTLTHPYRSDAMHYGRL
jgi:hypothetical protein